MRTIVFVVALAVTTLLAAGASADPPVPDRNIRVRIDAAKTSAFPQLQLAPWATVDHRLTYVIDAFTAVLLVDTTYQNTWHRFETSMLIHPTLRVGLISDALLGTGPRIETVCCKGRVSLVGATLFPPPPAAPAAVINLRIRF